MDFLEMFLQASIVVKSVMVLLLILSLISWKIIFSQSFILNKNFQEIKSLEQENKNNTYQLLYNYISKNRSSLLRKIFKESLDKFNKKDTDSNYIKKYNKWAFENNDFKINREIEKQENKIKILATFSSVAPYIGLLGTVWGIMDAFITIGNLNNVSLSDIAPSIAEALIATAIGLFVAIPSSIYYNKFISNIDYLKSKYNSLNREIYIKIEKIILENEEENE
mgnify:CR=1 FL=1